MAISASCNKDADGPVLVEFDSKEIKANEFYNSIPPDVWKFMSEKEKRDYLQRYIHNEIIVQDVSKRQLDEDPDVKARLNAARQEILEQVFLDVIVNPRIEINQNEIREYYRQNQVQFARETDEYWIYQMLLRSEAMADSVYDVLDEADDSLIYEKFVEIAKQLNIDTNSIDQGFVAEDNIIDDIAEKIDDSKKGSLIEPIKSPVGYFIIYYKDFGREGTLHNITKLEGEIENILFKRKQKEIRKAIIDSLIQYHKPQINQAVLDSLLMINRDI